MQLSSLITVSSFKNMSSGGAGFLKLYVECRCLCVQETRAAMSNQENRTPNGRQWHHVSVLAAISGDKGAIVGPNSIEL